MADKQLGVLLACFPGVKSGARAHRPLEARFRSNGDDVLDTVVLEINAKHHASVHDPHRVLAGTLTPALTWGLFGLLTGGSVQGFIVWAVIGAICGGLSAYAVEHIVTKAELTRIGSLLSAQTSAVLSFVETSNPRSLFEAARSLEPSVASVAAIAGDLRMRSYGGPFDSSEPPLSRSALGAAQERQPELVDMILVRYGDPKTAGQVVARPATGRTAPG
jgi:hypothetical protein